MWLWDIGEKKRRIGGAPSEFGVGKEEGYRTKEKRICLVEYV